MARCAFTLLAIATLLCGPAGGLPARAGTRGVTGGGPARTESASPTPAPAPSPSRFIALTILGSAVRVEGDWDSGFGGELAVGALPERVGLAAWAASVQVLTYSERSCGRAGLEGAIGTRWPTGLLVGAAAGPVVELDDVRKPRLGGQASVWVFAGVIPYVRVGTVERTGAFVDVGLRIPLPVWRW
jgi:hypothetical protein